MLELKYIGFRIKLPGVVLLNLPVNFLSDLSKLQLGTKDLVLLLFKSSLSLLESRLKLLLLNLEAPSLLVKLMNRAASISQLLKEVLEMTRTILVCFYLTCDFMGAVFSPRSISLVTEVASKYSCVPTVFSPILFLSPIFTLISSARFLFSLLTTSSCSMVSSQAAFRRKSSLL